jgi:hypothetical protein
LEKSQQEELVEQMVQMVECLSSKCEALSSNPTATKNKRKKGKPQQCIQGVKRPPFTDLAIFLFVTGTPGRVEVGLNSHTLVPDCLFIFAVLEFELRTYTLSHSTSPFL